MMTRYLHHITLATCHTRESYRGEVDDAVIAPLQALIGRFAAGRISEPQPIPGMEGYSVSGRAGGKCMVASIYADGPPSELLLSIGVAGHERCGAAIWRTLHSVGLPPGSLLPSPDRRVDGEYRRTDPDHQPRTPWCAVAMELAISEHRDVMMIVGDLERCLAWAWLDYLAARAA